MLILSAINPEQALSDDEAELMELDLAAVAAGSTEALERLYNTAKAAVYSYSLSVLRNVQDAEDVLHDCFVNIFTAAAGYRPHGKPMAWIITIAKNLCFARLRQHNRQEQLPDEDWSEMLADNAGLSNEDRLVLRECLGRLSEEDRCSSRRGRVQAQGDCFRYGNAACNRSFKISQGNREAPRKPSITKERNNHETQRTGNQGDGQKGIFGGNPRCA